MTIQDPPQAEKSPAQLFNEAVSLSNDARFAEAADQLRHIVDKFPDFSPATDALAVVLSNLAVVHGRAGDFARSAASLIESLCLEPGAEAPRAMLAEALANQAVMDLDERRVADIFKALGRSLRITREPSPKQAQALINALVIDSFTVTPGMSWAEKLAQLDWILEREPDHRLAKIYHMIVAPLYCRGVVNMPALEDARLALRRAADHAKWLLARLTEEERSNLLSALYALGSALSRYGDADKGLDLEQTLCDLYPRDPNVHKNRMFSFLYKDDRDSAWKRESWEACNRAYDTAPMWDGQTPGDVIHLVNNNGMGDFLQSLRLVPALADHFTEIRIWDPAFATQKHRYQMSSMLARSPGFEKVSLHPGKPRLTAADTYCELFALPFALHATNTDYAAPKPYLAADPELVAHWSSLIRKPGRLSVAFVWSVGAGSATDWRNIGLDNIATLFGCSDRIDFYSIQNTAAKFDLLKLDRPPTVTDLGIVDFEHMAALINSVDVTITPDCGLTHIAGATGAPVWVGVHTYCDWRWRGTADRADLYGSARLFRQPTPGDWPSVSAAMREALIELAEQVASQPLV